MSRKETAYKFLSEDVLRNSYLIARLEDGDIYMDDEKNPNAVLVNNNNEVISMRGDTDILVDLLKKMEPGEYRFHSIDPESFGAAEKYVEDIDDSPTWMLYRPEEEFGTPENYVDELNLDDVPVINEHWGLGDQDSSDYISHRIKDGPAYGIRKDGELVGWVLTHYITDSAICLGFLHVKEGWRRKGFAKDLTDEICKYAAEHDLTPVVDIFQDNVASLSLSKSLGFEKIGENHWFDGNIPK